MHAPRSLPAALSFTVLLLVLSGCELNTAWNNPYPPEHAQSNRIDSAFSEQPAHLDPARSYSADEYAFIAQIYEPPLQYHFLHRPYQLEPLTADSLPVPRYFNAKGESLSAAAPTDQIASSEYVIRIRPGIQYQPHPAFAQDATGNYRYHHLTPAQLTDIKTLTDFPATGTRELTAEDYVYQIKRLATPWRHSPIAGLLTERIVDFADLTAHITAAAPPAIDGNRPFFDLRSLPFRGAEVIDRYSYRIRINGRYPQFLFWLAMPFFAPMPWEAEAFYDQPGMANKNLTLDWYPIGTGPFFLSENNPNLRMVLTRNPHYHAEHYPTSGSDEDRAAGLLTDAGQRLPFIDQAVYSLEKETIPYWTKFLQGYYDSSGVSSDAFDRAIQFDNDGSAALSPELTQQGIQLTTAVNTSIWYLGFNWRDPVVGGTSERARLLRQALAIAIDFEEYIAIFANGRGMIAHSPIPPSIFGYRAGEAGVNTAVYTWEQGHARRRSLIEAQQLLTQAGYANGQDPTTHKALTLYYEAMDSGPDSKAQLNWMRKQFAKLGIELVIRATDYNRFQEKMRDGSAQIFMWGWNADYPDPENFFFLLYGPNRKQTGGENAANYHNPEFDRLFEQMKDMDDSPARQAMIDQMIAILRHDAPWAFGFFPQSYSLNHAWLHNVKPNLMANNTLKYRRVDPIQRDQLRTRWNQPILWPLGVFAILLGGLLLPVIFIIRHRERRSAYQ
ncbi:ABC transporter substrate-binding protein [Rhodoferax sp. 4810]|uniref:ABC transporter substrate-binding protein n=1 Tax=Thiospirillum jenense TaxID=1653858 RepID=A0A839HDJ7_9GAMM|nr:ABC transporter substrate-binding protein [Thiospirillum jenense]MBB1074690.1 ABC transporter substrate-binding protein [Rhodoferax jenense]MBB1125466.1 ABC transporter substrate-binding protein [Thiospirillum jenense]